jgi:hypothetical protein
LIWQAIMLRILQLNVALQNGAQKSSYSYTRGWLDLHANVTGPRYRHAKIVSLAPAVLLQDRWVGR